MPDPRTFANLHIIDHPLIHHKLSLMRRKDTPTTLFRQLAKEISQLMGYEVTRHVPVTRETIETPMDTMEAPVLAGRKPAIVAILRAGLGMVDGIPNMNIEGPDASRRVEVRGIGPHDKASDAITCADELEFVGPGRQCFADIGVFDCDFANLAANREVDNRSLSRTPPRSRR